MSTVTFDAETAGHPIEHEPEREPTVPPELCDGDKRLTAELPPAEPVHPIISYLETTIEFLDERGWQRGALGDYFDGPVCLIGALDFADHRNPFRQLAINEVRDTIRARGTEGIAYWNDRVATGERDVHGLLIETIERLR